MDYSEAENWIIVPTDCSHEVDVVFYYPTCVMNGTDTTQALNDAEKIMAYAAYAQGVDVAVLSTSAVIEDLPHDGAVYFAGLGFRR